MAFSDQHRQKAGTISVGMNSVGSNPGGRIPVGTIFVGWTSTEIMPMEIHQDLTQRDSYRWESYRSAFGRQAAGQAEAGKIPFKDYPQMYNPFVWGLFLQLVTYDDSQRQITRICPLSWVRPWNSNNNFLGYLNFNPIFCLHTASTTSIPSVTIIAHSSIAAADTTLYRLTITGENFGSIHADMDTPVLNGSRECTSVSGTMHIVGMDMEFSNHNQWNKI